MKKQLFAMFLALSAGCVYAQANVTLWGVLDADIGHYSLNGKRETLASTSGHSPSQLGFRGSEDLGGGMEAGFWLEASLLNNSGAGSSSGALAFQRRSTVGLSTPFGEIRAGRENAPTFWNYIVFDPFAALGPGASSNIGLGSAGNGNASGNPLTAVYVSNAVSYLYGFAPHARASIGRGLYVQLMHAFANQPNAAPQLGDYNGGRVGYSNGALNIALAFAKSVAPPAYGATGKLDSKEMNVGASYDFGLATVMARIGRNDTPIPGTRFANWSVSAIVKAGSGTIPVSYNVVKQNNAASSGAHQIAIGYVYPLSKRTELYTTASHLVNKNGGTFSFRGGNGGGNPALPGGGTGTGYDVGIKTSF